MSYQTIIEKLASLFIENGPSVIENLVQLGFIAGGSIVWALDTQAKYQPSDIDLFVNETKNVDKVISMVENIFGSSKIDRYVYEKEGKNVCSIVDINIGKGPQIQIVCLDTGFKETIDLFDMDYVQCGIYKDEFYISDACKKAHETKEVWTFYELPSKRRLEKAFSKGFKVPYFILDQPNTDFRSQFKSTYEVDQPMTNPFDGEMKNIDVDYFVISNRSKTNVYQRPKLVGMSIYKDRKVFELDVGLTKNIFATHISFLVDNVVCIVDVNGKIVQENVGYIPIF